MLGVYACDVSYPRDGVRAGRLAIGPADRLRRETVDRSREARDSPRGRRRRGTCSEGQPWTCACARARAGTLARLVLSPPATGPPWAVSCLNTGQGRQ